MKLWRDGALYASFLMRYWQAIRTTVRQSSPAWQNFEADRPIENRWQRLWGGGLFELRHVGKLNTRVLWFFMKGRRIVAVHGIRNKGQAIAPRDITTARERMHDWQERMT
jgi:phage-related protein